MTVHALPTHRSMMALEYHVSIYKGNFPTGIVWASLIITRCFISGSPWPSRMMGQGRPSMSLCCDIWLLGLCGEGYHTAGGCFSDGTLRRYQLLEGNSGLFSPVRLTRSPLCNLFWLPCCWELSQTKPNPNPGSPTHRSSPRHLSQDDLLPNTSPRFQSSLKTLQSCPAKFYSYRRYYERASIF